MHDPICHGKQIELGIGLPVVRAFRCIKEFVRLQKEKGYLGKSGQATQTSNIAQHAVFTKSLQNKRIELEMPRSGNRRGIDVAADAALHRLRKICDAHPILVTATRTAPLMALVQNFPLTQILDRLS